MQELKELVLIVTKNRIRSMERLRLPLEGNSKLAELYEGIASNAFNADADAAVGLYGEADQGNYRKLKSLLRKRLINSLFFIDLNKASYNDYQRAYYECYKNWAAVRILMGKNANLAAVHLCHQLLHYAKRYDFTDLCIDTCRTLRLHYATREGNEQLFSQYNQEYKRFAAINDAEALAEELYLMLAVRYVRDKSTKEEIQRQARQYYTMLEEPMALYPGNKLQLHGYLIKLMIHTAVNDYEGAVPVCEEAISFFQAKEYEAHVPLQIFLYQELVCFIQLRRFAEGKEAAERCLNLLVEGSFNWFKYQELYLMLALHTQEYQEAYRVFTTTVNHPRFQFLPAYSSEMWKILKGYLHYLMALEKFNPEEGDETFNAFRLGRFLNEIPVYSKDKRGMNIAILILQIVTLILQQRFNDAIDRFEAIEKYCSRYLQQGATFRSNCFIKMLLQIPQGNFNRATVIRLAKRYETRLNEVPLEIANQSHEVEIIPYENLWELVLQSLKNKKYTRVDTSRLSLGSRGTR